MYNAADRARGRHGEKTNHDGDVSCSSTKERTSSGPHPAEWNADSGRFGCPNVSNETVTRLAKLPVDFWKVIENKLFMLQ
jgi:hypothetical protein